ncbi:hypothetical protein TW81_12120 [Vibrio galatheae]|uniref:Uncharacterized protein n=1 Tax=Vibrio galatheae TaxID=579748 RepID=A0A0F4NIJ9_9VIBR|nr:hypothetical protein [Vibrio galatheae]KJY82940.1 hypothetical protein TW81_12120 [Vibrio galatheae]
MKISTQRKALATIASIVGLQTGTVAAHQDEHIIASSDNRIPASFDLIHSKVIEQQDRFVFQLEVRDHIGSLKPDFTGALAGAQVYSYVWPTSLDSSAIGFDKEKGIVALAVTAHPDFDDTPLYDENGDGNLTNDGDQWHSHWVVLVKDETCAGGLKVRDIPENSSPTVPETWPKLPIYIDSPDFSPEFTTTELRVEVPKSSLTTDKNFNFDSVSAVLKVNANVHAPLLCVTEVHDIASGDLSLPGRVSTK